MPRPHILLIGPLPPPYGGARVSFSNFYHYITGLDYRITFRDLPHPRRHDEKTARFRHLRILLGVIGCLLRIPFVDRLIIFNSPHFGFSHGCLMLLWASMWRTPATIRFFGGHPFPALADFPAPLRSPILWMLGRASRIVVETRHGFEEFPRNLHNRMTVVWGYRTYRQVVERSEKTGNPVRFICPSASQIKGLGVLRRALDLLEKEPAIQAFEVHLYGDLEKDDADTDLLRQKSHVTFHGQVPHRQLLEELPDFDVFLFPSIYKNEGHPGALIEALMAGLPSLISDLPCPMEIVEDGVHAIIAKAGDAKALADAMKTLIADKTLRENLGRAALEQGRLFDEESVLPKLSAELGAPPT
ncbi:MAG: glycosyltransferase family 4 protein [Acidobacteriota bacterium]|nr:glycosyltransferase family 4 protein [Acidobacteriota bacterium]